MIAGLSLLGALLLSPPGPAEIGFDPALRLPRVEELCKVSLLAAKLDNTDYEVALVGFHSSESLEYGIAVSEANAVVVVDLLNEIIDLPDGVYTMGSDYKSLEHKSGVAIGTLASNNLRRCYCEYEDRLFGELEAIASPHLSQLQRDVVVMNGLNWEYNPAFLVIQVLPAIKDRGVQFKLLSMLLNHCKVKVMADRPDTQNR